MYEGGSIRGRGCMREGVYEGVYEGGSIRRKEYKRKEVTAREE